MPVMPLLVTLAILVAVLLLFRSGWPQRIGHTCVRTGQALLQVVRTSEGPAPVGFGVSCSHHVPAKLRMKAGHQPQLTRTLTSAGATHVREMVRVITYYRRKVHRPGPDDLALCLSLEQDLDHGNRRATLDWTKSAGARDRDDEDSKTIALTGDAAAALADLLEDLGYSPMRRVETQRHRWAWHGCGVNIDRVPHLGRFVEIDGPSERAAQKIRQQLGLGSTPLIEKSEAAMIEDWLADHGVQDKYVALESERS